MEPMELGSDDESFPSHNQYAENHNDHSQFSAARNESVTTSSTLNASKTWEPALTTVCGAAAFKRKKVGYGLPDGQTVFGHFPNKDVHKAQQRGADNKVASSTTDENLGESQRGNLKTSDPYKGARRLNTTDHDKGRGGGYTCLNLLWVLVVVIMLSVAVKFVMDFQKRQACRLSRQFSKNTLVMNLETNVYGQHIAIVNIPHMIDEYFAQFAVQNPTSVISSSPELKPLVLSFHGWPGTGKNHISTLITQTFLFSKVSYYNIPFHFPHNTFEDRYGRNLHNWIVGNFTDCAVNIIIIDEMDKALPGIVRGLADAVVDLTRPYSTASPTIFLLLSNTHAAEINQKFLQHIQEKTRDELSQEDFNTIFTVTDSWYSKLLEENALDAFIPFLPLEKSHVKLCIQRNLRIKALPTDSGHVDRILQELTFAEFGDLQLSTTGCKRVTDKVDYVMYESKRSSLEQKK